MDPIQEHLKELQATAPRQRPVLYGQTPLYRLKPSKISELNQKSLDEEGAQDECKKVKIMQCEHKTLDALEKSHSKIYQVDSGAVVLLAPDGGLELFLYTDKAGSFQVGQLSQSSGVPGNLNSFSW